MKGKKGLTAVELIIVLTVIFAIILVAVPAIFSLRIKSNLYTCIGNLRQIDTAKIRWSVEYGENGGLPLTIADLVPHYLRTAPVCPTGGTYHVRRFGILPACTVPTHNIPGNGE